MTRAHLSFAILILLCAAGLRLAALATWPPGPHYDEAANLLIGRSIAFGGAAYFPIVPAYQGREVLYYYLSAPALLAVHDSIFALQLTSAFAGLLTVAATIALGRALLPGRRGVIVGLVAGALLALSFPHLFLSRQAFRAITLPLCQALALWALWRGLHARRAAPWLIAGGALAGAALYTYMASRLFPLWLLLAGLALLLLDRRRARLRQGVIFFGALALTAAPMALYALQNPDIFLGRLTEVTEAGEAVTLAESIRLHLRMFFIEGDPYLRYNIPGRPYFTPVEGALLLLGLAVAGWRLLRPGPAAVRAGYALLLLAPLMILPSVISVAGLPPSHMRSVGMVPLIFIAVGVGFEALWSRISARSRLAGAVAAAALIMGALYVGSLYGAWAGRGDLFYEADAALAAAADWLRMQADDDSLIYIGVRDPDHPTLTTAYAGPVRWVSAGTLFAPPPDRAGLYLFPRSAPPPDTWRAWLSPGAVGGLPAGPDGHPAFEAFRVAAGGLGPSMGVTLTAQVGNPWLRLIGLDAPQMLPAGRDHVTTYWRVEAPPPFAEIAPVLEIQDSGGRIIDRAETPLAGADSWGAGEMLIQRIPVQIPVGTPPGAYSLHLRWFDRGTGALIPFTDAVGAVAGVSAGVGALTVIRPTQFPDPAELPIRQRAPVDAAPGVRLLGWDAPAESARPGETLYGALYWQAIPAESARASVTVRSELVDATGAAVSVGTGRPVYDSYDSAGWIDGELVVDRWPWLLPRDRAGGRSPLRGDAGEAVVALGAVVVDGAPRLFEAPPVDVAVDAFGPALGLYGWVLRTDAGLDLRLVWAARAAVETDYTAFVHLVDETGALIAQQDRPPRGDYPTRLWLPGEYVTDAYRFDPSPGRYTIRVGLYDQATGARLPLGAGDAIEIGPVVIGGG